MKHITLFLFLLLTRTVIIAQTDTAIEGRIFHLGAPLEGATIKIENTKRGTVSDSTGQYIFEGLPDGTYRLLVSRLGFVSQLKVVQVAGQQDIRLDFNMEEEEGGLEEVVITGTMKEVNRLETPVPVEVYNHNFFKKNPTATVFDALQMVNGVRPQINCNVCNTGDIHINGLEGPYTMVLIDGMPIVSGLSTVYGLSGIPSSLIERVEVVKGPASSLYGSEAVGGLINIITKKPQQASRLSADIFGTSWREYNADLGLNQSIGKKANVLTGVNYFNFTDKVDHNHDGFTDMTLQNRISVFQKWNFNRKENRLLSLAGRYLYEDRWGGQTTWNKSLRGSDKVYGESIYTKRWEVLGNYQLPVKEKMFFMFSYNNHDQNSVYGDEWYLAKQRIAFGQLTWDKRLGKHDLLIGAALRYTYYNDNTAATELVGDDDEIINDASKMTMPGVFLQDEIKLADKHSLLLGMRYDYNSDHGDIFTPRMAYKWSITDNDILRLNAGTGFRVVNLFTEDHAALTGARDVEIEGDLKPERSVNVNLNYIKKLQLGDGNLLSFESSAWYTYFNNRILPNYDLDPRKIIYRNLDGHGVTRGISLNADLAMYNGLKLTAGGTWMNVFNKERNEAGAMEKFRPILTENWTATWALSYHIKTLNLGIDYTGNIYGPMRLALLSELDPRPEYSPVWSIQNIQFTWHGGDKWEIYGGIKNLLDWTISKSVPAIAEGEGAGIKSPIARSFDPFNRGVVYGSDGRIVPTSDNPYGLQFDPDGYAYGPNQGIRGFLGVRIRI
ncbi:MAG: TonB-dependent receptor [Pseudosphingobacterium sp.]|nr:TonB-dependent receptor [Pseudosphingobacterium sp.]